MKNSRLFLIAAIAVLLALSTLPSLSQESSISSTMAAVEDLAIGGSHWRTYSRKALHQGLTGTWTVEARDAEGNVLASSTFTCVAAPGEGE